LQVVRSKKQRRIVRMVHGDHHVTEEV